MFESRALPEMSMPVHSLADDLAGSSFLEELCAASLRGNVEIDKIAALIPMQRDLYLAFLFNADELTFSVGITLRLGKDIDPENWYRAVSLVVEHDDVPKTIFYDYHGQIFQMVTREACHFELIDARNWQGREVELEEFVRGKIRVQHHLLNLRPQWYNYLIMDWRHEYLAVVSTHHILSDGFDMKVFIERVCTAYEAVTEHQSRNFSSLSFYTSIPAITKRFDTRETLAYWKESLWNVISLPAERECHTGHREVRKLQLVGEELQQIKAYCAQHHYRLPTYFRFLYGELLSRYYAVTEDFVIYNLLNGRSADNEEALGCFYEILPIVLKKELFAQDASLHDCLQAMRQYRKIPAAYQHISTLQQIQLLPEEPLRFYYNFYNFGYVHFQECMLDFTDYDYYGTNEVHIVVDEKPDQLEISLYYHSSTFVDAASLERLLMLSQQGLAGAERLSVLVILLPLERERILALSSHASAAYPYDNCFSPLFEAQVGRTLDVIVVADRGGEQVAYAVLHEHAFPLAKILKAQGIGSERVAALLCERDLTFWIAVLAIFQAGGAYLPLNPSHPTKQLSLVLSESQVSLLLISSEMQDTFAQVKSHLSCSHLRVLLLSELLLATQERASRSLLPFDNLPTKLAYIIYTYTSGSTGMPKGAMVEQQGMENHLFAKISDLQLGPEDIVAQNASQSFDISVWQFTECSDDVSRAMLFSPLEDVTSSISIANLGLYVLDRTLSLVPLGMSGEWYVSGIGPGYMSDPEKTAERLLPDLFRPTLRTRLYRTGDIVRYQPDGGLEFLGHADFQVKIRGFRIELSEVELALNKHPTVSQALVLVQEDQRGNKRLVAYIVLQTGMNLNREDLSRLCSELLPAYVLPSAFVFLQDFPLNHHGKINRQALSNPSILDTHITKRGSAESDTGDLSAEIWSQELGFKEVGVDDDFFSVGGNSLSAIRILASLQESGQTEITLRDLFTLPTIARLARYIDEAGGRKESHS